MKKIFCLAIVLAVFVNVNTFSATRKSSSSKKSSSSQSQSEPVRIVLKFLREYVKGGDNYIENSNLVTDRFRAKYYKEVAEYIEKYGILEYVPIVGGQDPAENYALISYNPSTGMVVVKPVYPGDYVSDSKIKLKVKNINGKWIIDDYIQTYDYM